MSGSGRVEEEASAAENGSERLRLKGKEGQ